ncbi:major tail protein [Streptomyces phage Xkcd426]|nr:major tail protein [Streptomyces phage Xkcd426]
MSCDLIANLDVVRVTKVDNCGLPLVGENAFVSECVASVAMNPNIDEQDDVIYRAANGSLCGVKRGCPSLLGYDLEFNFYQVSPQMTDVLTNQPVVVDNLGEPVGFDSCNINCQGGFALEFWTELVGQNCTTTGAQRYLYTLIPWVTNAYLSDLEIGSEAVTFQLVGSSRAGGRWGEGPYNVVLNGAAPGTPGPMLTPLGATCHRRMQITTVAPPVPDPACDYATVPPLAP